MSTGYGQPPTSLYDWTLAPVGMAESGFKLPEEMDARLRIEVLSDKVTSALYSNPQDPVGLAGEQEKAVLVGLLARELDDFEQGLKPDMPSINLLYLRAVRLHLRLSVLFDPPTTRTYDEDLLALYVAATTFLAHALELQTPVGDHIIAFASNYILQLIVASGFALLKLLHHSTFARLVDREQGQTLFAQAVHTIRAISVAPNDLPSRLAEVLSQLWRASARSRAAAAADWGAATPGTGMTEEESLRLKVRCRMSMSVVYDSVWRWREEFQMKGRGNLECMSSFS